MITNPKDLIDRELGGHGAAILTATDRTRSDLARNCALVEIESGGRNIFGGDHGDVGDRPPYYRQPVTRERVQALRAGGSYSHGQNGVGLTQLTSFTFVEQAEKLGGAHMPVNQCVVGFAHMKMLIHNYWYMEALGAYNAGEGNRRAVIGTYAAKLSEAHERWDRWLGTEPRMQLAPDGFRPPPVRAGNYQDRHPTRYTFRPDVTDLVRRIYKRIPGLHINTYVDHPEGWGRTLDSFDCWAEDGRNFPVGFGRGGAVADYVFYTPTAPFIEWYIWRRRMYLHSTGAWQPFGTDPFSWHEDHTHHTLKRM